MSCRREKDKHYPGKIKRSKANKHTVYLCAPLSICKSSGGVLRGAFQQRRGRLCRREKPMVRDLKSSSCAGRLSNLLCGVCNAQKRRTRRALTHSGLKGLLEEKRNCLFSMATVNRKKQALFTKHFWLDIKTQDY